jgi:hypothetical protein
MDENLDVREPEVEVEEIPAFVANPNRTRI